MKEKILTGWNFRRVIYLLIGGFVIVQSVAMNQWPGVFMGGYLASMGIFAFGCAAGNCYSGPGRASPAQGDKDPQIVEFKEIK